MKYATKCVRHSRAIWLDNAFDVEEGFVYTRYNNPNRYELEAQMLDLYSRKAAYCYCLSNAMACLNLVLSVNQKQIIADKYVHEESRRLLNKYNAKYADLGRLGVEMESYGLFLNAMRLHKKALCILTVSDTFVNKDEKDLTKEERQEKLNDMFKLALSMAE